MDETNLSLQPKWDKSVIEVLSNGLVQAGFTGLPSVIVGQVQFGQWNHVALRYDKTSGQLDTFLNGQQGPSSNGDRLTPTEAGLKYFLAFGKSTREKFGEGDFFKGDLDEIRVWNTPRTDDQIMESRYKSAKPEEPGLVLYWKCEGRLADSSPLQNHGLSRPSDSSFVASGAGLGRERSGLQILPRSLSLQFYTLPNWPYRLQSTTDFVTWREWGTKSSDSQGIFNFALPRQTDQKLFFRVVP